MINRIIEFSAKNKFIVFLLVAAAGLLGWWSMRHVALDAIPDLSDTQVIVYSRWDRSPDLVEDQVTYPIVTAMLGAPKVKAVRQLSAGQQQRVVIARSLINRPEVLLADEPTSNLDEQTEREIMGMLREIHASTVITILLVTHTSQLIPYGTRALEMMNGTIRTEALPV